jgi:hypothetical protein
MPRVRYFGRRKYKLLRETKSEKAALKQLCDAMATGKYKRGDILGLEEWYEPTVLFEMVRK